MSAIKLSATSQSPWAARNSTALSRSGRVFYIQYGEYEGGVCGVPSLHLKLDPLRQGRGRGAVIGRAGVAAHVGFPGVRPGLTAAAGVFLASESAANFGAAGANVDVHNTAVTAPFKLLRLAQIGSEDGRREPLRHSIMNGDRLIEAGIGHHVQNRRKSFGADNVHL